MLSTKQKGNITELKCITAFLEEGCTVSIPYGEDCRYDFIADICGHLIRVQSKTSRQDIDDSSITFSCQSHGSNTKENKRSAYSRSEVDYYSTYFDGECYLVPVLDGLKAKRLRLKPPKNNQTAGISYAQNYLLKTQIQSIKERALLQ